MKVISSLIRFLRVVMLWWESVTLFAYIIIFQSCHFTFSWSGNPGASAIRVFFHKAETFDLYYLLWSLETKMTCFNVSWSNKVQIYLEFRHFETKFILWYWHLGSISTTLKPCFCTFYKQLSHQYINFTFLAYSME